MDPYINAKVISHNLILNAMKKNDLPILILMPSAIIGIDDYKKTPSNLLINKFMSYPLNKFYINAGLNIINVKDVANAHCIGLSNSAISDPAGRLSCHRRWRRSRRQLSLTEVSM